MGRLGRDGNWIHTRAVEASFDLHVVWSPAKSNLAKVLTLVWKTPLKDLIDLLMFYS